MCYLTVDNLADCEHMAFAIPAALLHDASTAMSGLHRWWSNPLAICRMGTSIIVAVRELIYVASFATSTSSVKDENRCCGCSLAIYHSFAHMEVRRIVTGSPVSSAGEPQLPRRLGSRNVRSRALWLQEMSRTFYAGHLVSRFVARLGTYRSASGCPPAAAQSLSAV